MAHNNETRKRTCPIFGHTYTFNNRMLRYIHPNGDFCTAAARRTFPWEHRECRRADVHTLACVRAWREGKRSDPE